MKTIEKAYSKKHNENPYQVLEKPDILQRHWRTVIDTICSKKVDVDISTDLITLMVDCIIANDWTVYFWDDVVELMKRYFLTCNAKSENNRERVLKRVLHLVTVTTEDTYNKNPEMLGKMLGMFKELLEKKPEHMPWVYQYLTTLGQKTSAKGGLEKNWFPLLKACTRTMHRKGVHICVFMFRQKKLLKMWNWKVNYQEALDIIEPLNKAHLHLNGDDKDARFLENCGNTIYELLEHFNHAKVSEKLNGHATKLAMTILEKRSVLLNNFIDRFVRQITLENNKEDIPGLMTRFAALFYDTNYIWDDYTTHNIGMNFMEKSLKAFSSGKEMPDELNKTLVEMFLWVMETEDLDYMNLEFRKLSLYGHAASEYLYLFTTKHIGTKTSEVILPLLPAIVRQMKHEEKELAEKSQMIVYQISINDYKLLEGYLEPLVVWYKETHSAFALRAIWKPFEESDGFKTSDFKDMMEAIEEDTDNSKIFTHGMLMKLMAERQPELFTQKHVNLMIDRFLDDKLSQPSVLIALGEVVASQPQLFGDDMVERIFRNPNLNSSSLQVIAVNLGLQKKEMVNTILDELISLIKVWNDPNHQISLLDSIRILGAKYGVEYLRPHRKLFEDIKKYGKSSAVKDMSAAIVNAMDGVSMEGIITDVIQTKKKVKTLDKKVTKVQEDVSGMKASVEKQDKVIKTVETGLQNVEKRVDVVEKDLDETKARVEEIDNKTMSNAPAWSRDLTKLMNPKADNDWRLLGQRLGYSLDDIKAWATHSDPCMALLNEWYATHRMIEATHAVLNILQDINRLDAAVLVENAMKAVEDVVEEPTEYTKPPPIFLSYQWGHQNEVKLLRQHLLMAGYECWMDVGQMGGGDKLFEKIDNGIRGSKVIICCVSEKYAKSPNCNREVNLAVNLGKPMIPLLMEKMGWPPQGSMGPIFSEYLFVRFFQRKGEETEDQRFWPAPKFHELLMQLNIYKTLPDESLITKEYKDWWIPVAEEVVIYKKLNSQSGAAMSQTKDEESKSPDVFLSYQWGKQKQIKQLYKRLSELGLTCWMDIYQMGGGDSLFDKIDRGVRGCKIMLSCVTTKYIVSANCRREMTLADSLKKPVVSLLLENMTWPPTGPMSTVFTQFPLIEFNQEEDIQMTWTGIRFEDLLDQIMEHVPNTIGYVKNPRRNEEKTETKGNTNIMSSDQNSEREQPENDKEEEDMTQNSESNGFDGQASSKKSRIDQNTKDQKEATKPSLGADSFTDDDPPPAYDSLFSQSASRSTSTENKKSTQKTMSEKKKEAAPTVRYPPPPYLYRHKYVEIVQPIKSEKNKSSSCVIV
ncbi:uncharacterized protein [Argopecten irradians]